jgi:hypothetical protein
MNSNHDPWLYQVHDSSWRVVATVFAVDDSAGTEAGEYLAQADDEPSELFVFHAGGLNGRGTSSKLDDVILRDRDANTTWGNASDGTAPATRVRWPVTVSPFERTQIGRSHPHAFNLVE